MAANPAKRLVLVLNKVDLVPKEVAAGWLAVLRRAHPTIAFKASTQERAGRGAGVAAGVAAEDASEAVLQRGGAVGGEALLNVLKNYARSGDTKTSIAVGVIGYPNTGKSSLINSLKCESVVSTSSVAGHTKAMQEVKLDKHIRLLDSPGIVFDDAEGDASSVLRNCVNPDDLPDPEGAVAAMYVAATAAAVIVVVVFFLFFLFFLSTHRRRFPNLILRSRAFLSSRRPNHQSNQLPAGCGGAAPSSSWPSTRCPTSNAATQKPS